MRRRAYTCGSRMSSKARSHNRSGLGSPVFRKFDDLVCYRLLDVVVAISGPQGDADLCERDTYEL